MREKNLYNCRILLKLLKTNNRVLLIISLTVGALGCLLISDWQAIGHDPCSSADLRPLNTSINGSELSGSGVEMLFSGSGMDNVSEFNASGVEMLFSSSGMAPHQHYMDKCQAVSTSSHQCFYNPTSRVTGEFCNTCLPRCLSEQRSLNFYQLCSGVLLIGLVTPLGFVFSLVVTSAYASPENQVSQ